MDDSSTPGWDALVARAGVLLRGRDAARLEATARDMIACDPHHEMGYRYAGEARLRAGDAKGAVRWGREAVARAPSSDFVHYRLAAFLRIAGDRKAAREHIGKAIEQDPEYADYWVELGWITYLDEDTASAMSCADRAIELSPNDTDALYLRAAVLPTVTKAQARKALDAYEGILKADPEHDESWGEIARLRLQVGDVEGAEHAARTALSLDPEDRDHRRALYAVLKRQSLTYRIFRAPGDLLLKLWTLIARLPWWSWVIVGLIFTSILWGLMLTVLALSVLWLTFFFPVIRLYEWVTTADIRRRAQEVAPRRGRWDIHRWPFPVRIGLFVVVVGTFWYGAWRLATSKDGARVIGTVVGMLLLLAIAVGLVWMVVDGVRFWSKRRRRKQVKVMLEDAPREAR